MLESKRGVLASMFSQGLVQQTAGFTWHMLQIKLAARLQCALCSRGHRG